MSVSITFRKVNNNTLSLTDIAVGDFVADYDDDLFLRVRSNGNDCFIQIVLGGVLDFYLSLKDMTPPVRLVDVEIIVTEK